MTEDDIVKICEEYEIENYTINPDMSIDVDGSVDLHYKHLISIQLSFNKVSDDFSCDTNSLSSLEHCPTYVGGNFYCSNNKLTSLEYCPKYIGGVFYCSTNNLTSLQYCPKKINGDFFCLTNKLTSLEYCPTYIGGDFYCVNNELTTLKDLPINFYVGGGFNCRKNKITSPSEYSRIFFGTISGEITTGFDNLDEFLNKYKNPPKKDLPKILSELRKLII